MDLNILNNLECDQSTKDLIVKYNGGTVTHTDLAREYEFTSNEVDMLKTFWNPVFNKSWVVLEREDIRKWFCADTDNKDAIHHFYTRILLKKYTEDVDYKKVCYPRVDSNTESRGGHNKIIYKVTGECFKSLGMERNKDIRAYYIKVEKLASVMCDYIHHLQTYNFKLQEKLFQRTIEKNERALAIKDKVIKSEKAKTLHMKNFITNAGLKSKNEWIYIATTKQYAANNHFKIGSTRRLAARISTYQTGRAEEDNMYYCWIFKCHNAAKLDVAIKEALSMFLENKTKEMYVLHYDYLEDLVHHICTNYTTFMDYINEFVTNVYPTIGDIPSKIPDKVEIEKIKVTISNVNDEKPITLENMSESEIINFLRDRIDHVKSDEVVERRKLLQPFQKKTETWNIFKSLFEWKNSKTTLPGTNIMVKY